MRILHLLTLAATIAAPIALHASLLTYTDTFTGSGSIGGVGFNNAVVTFTETADPSNKVNEGGGTYAVAGAATFSIGGVASGAFTDDIQVFANQGPGSAGFGDTSNGAALILTNAPAFFSYELGAIAPTDGWTIINSYNNTFLFYGTTVGDLELNTASDSTFSAVDTSAVPEPSSLVLLGTGVLGALGVVRRKFSAV